MNRNIQRLNEDLRLAQKKLGAEKIFWPKDGAWIQIKEFELPSNFSQKDTSLLILVPENYGYGGCWRDVFIDPNLKLLDRDGKSYRKLDRKIHGFMEYPYESMSEERKKTFIKQDWFYLCLHDLNSKSSIVGYLFKIKLFLGNPYKDWDSIAKRYKKEA